MNRILSWLGCFGLTLLVVLSALGVTETIKYVGPLERTLVLTAAVLSAAAVAYLRDRIKNGPLPALRKSELKDEPIQRSKDQPSAPAPASPIHDAILAARRQAILFRQIVPPNHDPAHLSFFSHLNVSSDCFAS
jgi:hypothetical protein